MYSFQPLLKPPFLFTFFFDFPTTFHLKCWCFLWRKTVACRHYYTCVVGILPSLWFALPVYCECTLRVQRLLAKPERNFFCCFDMASNDADGKRITSIARFGMFLTFCNAMTQCIVEFDQPGCSCVWNPGRLFARLFAKLSPILYRVSCVFLPNVYRAQGGSNSDKVSCTLFEWKKRSSLFCERRGENGLKLLLRA